jgi:hypothetical protein
MSSKNSSLKRFQCSPGSDTSFLLVTSIVKQPAEMIMQLQAQLPLSDTYNTKLRETKTKRCTRRSLELGLIPFFSSRCTKLTSLKSLDSALELIILKSSSCSSEECLAASKLVKLMFTTNLFALSFSLLSCFLGRRKTRKNKTDHQRVGFVSY